MIMIILLDIDYNIAVYATSSVQSRLIQKATAIDKVSSSALIIILLHHICMKRIICIKLKLLGNRIEKKEPIVS